MPSIINWKGNFMSEKFNSVCDICGKPYRVCNSCKDIKSFTPWRTITDTMDHYKIFLVLSNYTNTKDRARAKQELETCNLSELETFRPEIKAVIKEIMAEDKVVKQEDVKTEPVKKTVRKTSVNKVASEVKTDEVKDDIE